MLPWLLLLAALLILLGMVGLAHLNRRSRR
jgi:hypothetical protein